MTFSITKATVAVPALETGPPEASSGNGVVRRITAIGSMQANMKRAPKMSGFFLPTRVATNRMKSEQAPSFTAPNITVRSRSR